MKKSIEETMKRIRHLRSKRDLYIDRLAILHDEIFKLELLLAAEKSQFDKAQVSSNVSVN